jgi:hypothetical protein
MPVAAPAPCKAVATPSELALRHPHLTGGGFDVPAVRPVFEKCVATHGLADRLHFYPGDFFADPLPPADVLVRGDILVYESIIDDDRRANTSGLLMNVNMLIETQQGSDYTGVDCRSWMADIGFRDSYLEPLTGPDSMVVGLK